MLSIKPIFPQPRVFSDIDGDIDICQLTKTTPRTLKTLEKSACEGFRGCRRASKSPPGGHVRKSVSDLKSRFSTTLFLKSEERIIDYIYPRGWLFKMTDKSLHNSYPEYSENPKCKTRQAIDFINKNYVFISAK
jgi:hypothetical protein